MDKPANRYFSYGAGCYARSVYDLLGREFNVADVDAATELGVKAKSNSYLRPHSIPVHDAVTQLIAEKWVAGCAQGYRFTDYTLTTKIFSS
jgi:hypothetical protein